MKSLQGLTIKSLTIMSLAVSSSYGFAANFEFDHPGLGFSAGITAVGAVAWEQSLPTAQYREATIAGQKLKSLQIQSDTLLRTGLTTDTELQLAWGGPGWQKVKGAGQDFEISGLGDIRIGFKHAIDLDDDKMNLAILADAIIATGNQEFTVQDNIYGLASHLSYQYEPSIITGLTMRYTLQDSQLSVRAIPVIKYAIDQKWSGFSEVYYEKTESLAHEYGVVSGLIYKLTPHTQIDASVGVDLDGKDRNYQTGLGFSFLF